MASVASLALLLGPASTAQASPTVWDVVRQPELGRADELLAVA